MIARVSKLLTPREQGGAGMSQREAAREAGVSRQVVLEVAQGLREPQTNPAAGPIEFKQVESYKCPTCERTITTVPCVACLTNRQHATAIGWRHDAAM